MVPSASHDERRQLFGRSYIQTASSSQMEPELQKRSPKLSQERDDVTRIFKLAKHKGLSDRDLSNNWWPINNMSADDVSKLAAFTYQPPNIFKRWWLSNQALWSFSVILW